jgi:DNA-directed RNA polymerase subunit K/omega
MRKPSRGTDLDRQKCVAEAGGNQFDLVLLAAARARQLMTERSDADNCNSPMTALLEIQSGELKK